ncbi:nucleoside 2-deoxyribosyltransferase [Anoxybacillus sp. J5B_2022]|uniref:nucleoside 2-deoxyribosyltransferase n=1 Tax=Anoxybacillus sp. J5B_2022 TaxID=3003246 RepID=UPI002285DCD7|nr:nucleoside 2-deoxyribosyltransferase [Anoxybacillus sp. J5B_2022]MCZ0756138.1 nucleoside 2-deoxyribosyltransferase [Anoxybacillus sp. J5B_2022]
MRIFFAYPFTKLLNSSTGIIDEGNTNFILNAVNKLEEMGNSVFSAQCREKFGKELMDPDTATKLDFEEMKNADLVIAFPGQFPISGGVHVELGWASALGKPIIAFLHKDEMYTPMIQGLHTVTNVKYVTFDDNDTDLDIINKIITEVEKYIDIPAKV